MYLIENMSIIYHNHLNVEKMRKASEFLIGEHDFQSFTTLKTKKKSTIRNIYHYKYCK